VSPHGRNTRFPNTFDLQINVNNVANFTHLRPAPSCSAAVAMTSRRRNGSSEGDSERSAIVIVRERTGRPALPRPHLRPGQLRLGNMPCSTMMKFTHNSGCRFSCGMLLPAMPTAFAAMVVLGLGT
jgi:hypothetical protein